MHIFSSFKKNNNCIQVPRFSLELEYTLAEPWVQPFTSQIERLPSNVLRLSCWWDGVLSGCSFFGQRLGREICQSLFDNPAPTDKEHYSPHTIVPMLINTTWLEHRVLRNAALVWATRAHTYTYLLYPGRRPSACVRASHTTSASSVAGRVTLVQTLQKRSSITFSKYYTRFMVVRWKSVQESQLVERAFLFL